VQEELLDKTIRINRLFDFYHSLLTEKQQTFLRYYFQDDYTLGEIAGEFEISRQAVYEHIKRAQHMLEEYEEKLRLLLKQEERERLADHLWIAADRLSEPHKHEIKQLLIQLDQLDE